MLTRILILEYARIQIGYLCYNICLMHILSLLCQPFSIHSLPCYFHGLATYPSLYAHPRPNSCHFGSLLLLHDSASQRQHTPKNHYFHLNLTTFQRSSFLGSTRRTCSGENPCQWLGRRCCRTAFLCRDWTTCGG